MDTQWASDNLLVIRTLMERAALYRRALAPIMTVSGLVGLVGATIPCFTTIQSYRGFALFWMSVSLVALLASLLLVRRQALKDQEPFWSPPTRRVTQALAPAFFVGFMAGLAAVFVRPNGEFAPWLLACIWILCYGCGIHAAGFYMVRGIKLFGWIFLLGGSVLSAALLMQPEWRTSEIAHYVMGCAFGVLHLAYGIYLYFTEKKRKSA